MKQALLIGIAGAFGALSRYGIGSLISRLAGVSFPWGTFAVNMIGCFLFGFVWGLETVRNTISTETRAMLLIGFMGSFTTFSSFAFDTHALIKTGAWGMAALNILAQNALGIVALLGGIALSRVWP